MQVTKEQVDPCTITLDIQVEVEAVTKAFDRAYREFGGFTNVPGFRPGKAPRAMLEKFVNQTRLTERVRELLAGPAYRDAIKQEEINPFADPEVEFSDLANNQQWHFKATVPLPPQVKLGDYSKISVERPVYKASDEDILSQIEAMRNDQAKLEAVTGRGVEQDDVIIAETSVTLEGDEPSEPKRTLIRLGNNIPGFDEAVLAQQVDEERDFVLTYPDDYQEADLAGKRASFMVRVMSINRRVVPELTDEWVKGATAFQTVKELKKDVSERLQETYKNLSDQVAEARIIEQIIKASTIDFPTVMVHEEMEALAQELGEEIKDKMTYEEYLKRSGLTGEQHREKLASQAVDRIQSTLALRELAKAENLQSSPEEIDEEFDKLTAGSEVTKEQLAKLKADNQRRNQVANIIVKRKLRDFMFSKAKIKDVAAAEKK